MCSADDPEARCWLFAHWGTALPLRGCPFEEDSADRRLRRSDRAAYEFLSAD